jgi:hypothetical protein
VNDERLHHVLDRLATNSASAGSSLGGALCATCVDVLELQGAAITLQLPGSGPHIIGASNDVMAQLEEIERTLGEGPCIDAFNRGEPVVEPDLANPTAVWLGFTPPALEMGVRAAFGFPMQIGGTRFGAMNLYADRAGPLRDDQHEDALLLADVSTHAVLSGLAFPSPGALGDELLEISTNQRQVHQATGMISVQLSVSIADALARLRAHAYAEDRSIGSVAADVVARRLRFDP